MEDLYKRLQDISDTRNPGWDSKVISALLNYCHEQHNMDTPTHSLIYQLGCWAQISDDMAAITKIINKP